MKKSKRLLSFALALVMVLTLLPMTTAKSSAATHNEIFNEMIRILYNGNGGYMTCDFDGYKNTYVTGSNGTVLARHEGIDFQAKSSGAYVYSLISGEVLTAGADSYNTIAIYDSTHNKTVIYLHIDNVVVSKGATVVKGQKLATESNKGGNFAVHTHVEVRNGKIAYAASSLGNNYLENDPPYSYWESVLFGVTHTVDSSYGKNFKAYPKAKITATNIFDAGHNQISSTAWIGTEDNCTVNEVYTDGCCKVTYPLDGGGTKTVYSKISLFRMPQLKVYYNINGGKISSDTYTSTSSIVYKNGSKLAQTWTYNNTKSDGLYNAKTFGLTREGYTFAGWGTTASGGTVFDQDDSSLKPSKINSSLKNGDCSTTLYAQWTPNTLKVYYNANGGTLTSETYKLTSNLVYKTEDGTKYYQKWTYNNAKDNGLVDASTFGLSRTGYKFGGWGTSASGGTVYSSTDSTILPTQLNSAIKTGSCTTTLYAQWTPNTYTVKYNANGGSGTMSSSSHTYGTAKALNANLFTRDGYKFLGWATSASSTDAKYTDKQSVKNLTATNGGTVTLYAVWQQDVAVVTSISIENEAEKKLFATGDELNTDSLVIKAVYSDGTTEIITEGFDVSAPDMSTAGVKTVNVTYGGKTTSYEIRTVNVVFGDVNGNGRVNSADYAMLVSYIRCEETISDPEIFMNADINKDGAVDAMDAILLDLYLNDYLDF